MCTKANIKEIIKRWRDYWTICTLGEDSNVFESSKYCKDVWLLRRRTAYLYHSRSWIWRTVISSVKEVTSTSLSKNCVCNEAGLWSGSVDSFFKDYTPWYQTWEHSSSLSKTIFMQNVLKLCDFGWSVHQDNKMRTTFCGTPLYVCP